jgi:hypothetical protein
MGRVTAPGAITVSYDRYGEGPPLVLVYGWLQRPSGMANQDDLVDA